MSDAPRMPLVRAQAAAQLLMVQWHMPVSTCMIAGSIRRRCLECGDIDLVAPLPENPAKDDLFDKIEATCVGTGSLFGDEGAKKFTQPGDGFKRGFHLCRLLVQLGGVERDSTVEKAAVIPVQISRYAPGNRGWTEIRCTGPREFGVWFLATWKARYGIQMGEGGKASVDGFLVDAGGVIVPTPDERAAFASCGQEFIEPHFRDGFIAQRNRDFNRQKREVWR